MYLIFIDLPGVILEIFKQHHDYDFGAYNLCGVFVCFYNV